MLYALVLCRINKKGWMYMEFAESIKRIRTASKMTQTQLGNAVGISKDMVYQYESNRRKPSVYMAVKIAKALGTTCEDMVCPKGE